MSGLVEIKPEVLKGIVSKCLKQREAYDGSDDVIHTVPAYWVLFIRVKSRQVTEKPRWAYDGCGIDERLNALSVLADGAMVDGALVRLSELTYINLKRLEAKDSEFQPYIFAKGY